MDWNNFLKEKVKSDIKRLYLQTIFLLEDYLAANKLDENEFQRARKRTLDFGNSAIRSCERQIDEFEVKLKNKEQGK